MRLPLCLIIATGLLSSGCQRGIQNEAAVRQGVIDYYASKGLNVSAMQVDVTGVTFRENEADATVSFGPKGAGAAAGTQMRYTLERKGNRWVVKGQGQAPPGASPHGAGQGMPGSAEGQTPPGHPPMGGGSAGGAKPPAPEPPKK